MSIGPTLPPHLQQRRNEEDSSGCSGDEDFTGPRLPAVACRGPEPTPQEGEEESSDDDFGPALPPHLASRSRWSRRRRRKVSQDLSDSDEDCIGPKPPKPGESSSLQSTHISDIERRAKSMRDKIEGLDKKEVKRESWMMELPDAKAKSFGLGPRTFSRKGATVIGDRSAWTDTPEQRAKRARGEIQEQDETETTDYLINKARDETMSKVSEELKDKKGRDTLLEMHEKKRMKKAKKEKNKEEVRRPFDRDLDLGANKFDEAQRKLMVKKAAQIDSRFTSGSRKYL